MFQFTNVNAYIVHTDCHTHPRGKKCYRFLEKGEDILSKEDTGHYESLQCFR